MFDYGVGPRIGALAIAAVMLFLALRLHKLSGEHVNKTKAGGVILAFISGLLFLATIIGEWLIKFGEKLSLVGVAVLLLCLGVLAIDWAIDKKPDRPAFWSAFFLALFLAISLSQLPQVGKQAGKGSHHIEAQLPEGRR